MVFVKNKITEKILRVLFFLLFLFSGNSKAQDSITPSDFSKISNPVPAADFPMEQNLPMSRLEFQLSLVVLIFGFLIILLEIFLIKNIKLTAEESIKFIIITLIVTATLFLITAGYNNNQIAPAMGLLGTIAGYLLGRIQKTSKPV